MLIQARAQVLKARHASRFARRDRDIDRGQCVLVQTKRLSREAFDAIARHRGTEGARRNAQPQSRVSFMVGQDRYTKKRVGKFSAAPLHIAKFGRLVQTLARLERQFTVR
jgi:hypothetical protein